MAEALLGSRAQAIVGLACIAVGAGAWIYGATLQGEALLRLVFHVSMFFGLVACYAVVANALTIRKTEHVEAQVAEVEHADRVEADRIEQDGS